MATGRRRTIAATGGAALILLVGLQAYGFSLRLPLFLDDMVHFRWLAWHGFAGIWSTARLLGYYRPLPFTLWKALWSLQGRLVPWTLHAVNLALHLLNALLVLALVAGRGRGRHLGLGLAAALLFALFPFSYQAVPWVGSLTHPLVTALVLGALVLYQAGQRAPDGKPRRRSLLAASLGLALLAPFAHETGVLVAPLLVLLLVTAEEPRPLTRALRETAPYWVCAACGLAAWLLVPKGVGSSNLLDLQSRWQNVVYFLQALAYPVAPLAARFTGEGRQLSDLQAVVLVALPAVTAWALLLWRAGRGRLVVLALGWFGLCVAPAWLMLGFSYVIDGPRLLYEASVGAALFWAIPLSLPFRGQARQVAATALAALVAAWAGVLGYRFIRARMPIYDEMGLAVGQLLEAGAGAVSQPLLCINYPSWFAPLQATYALGHEGMTLVPAYTGVADLWWLHTGEDRPITAAVLPDVQTPWRYHYVSIGEQETAESLQPTLRTAGRVIVTRYDGPHVAVCDAGDLEAEGQPAATSFAASFAGRMALLTASRTRQAQALRIELRWQCWGQVEQDTTVFLHLYNEARELVAQADGYPLMGTARLTAWQPGDVWRDVRLLPLPDGLAPGQYTVEAGLYPVAGGDRLAALSPAGERFPNDAVPIATVSLP